MFALTTGSTNSICGLKCMKLYLLLLTIIVRYYFYEAQHDCVYSRCSGPISIHIMYMRMLGILSASHWRCKAHNQPYLQCVSLE